MNRFRSTLTKPCNTIRKYENAAHIVYKGLTLEKNEEVQKLSTFKDSYLEKVRQEIHGVFPEPREGMALADMEVFDPRLFRGYRRNTIMSTFRRASKYLGIRNINER